MPNVYDREGNLVSVDSPQQAAEMVKSGQFAFPPDQKVQLQDSSGKVFDVDAKDAAGALASGMDVAGAEAVRHAEVQETYGGAGGAIASMGFHGLDALGLNAATEALIQSKAKLHGVSPDVIRQEIMGLREANPVASGVGTGLGLIAPSLLTGGGAAVAEGGALTKGLYGAGRVLTAPGRAIGALGEGVGGLVGGALGAEGAGFLSKLATRGATLGASGAAELGAYGGLATIGEASLGDDHELTAEKFWSGVGDGALVGLLGGAGLGALSATGSAIKGEAKDLLSRVRGRGKDVEALAEKTFGESADGLGGAYSRASAAVSGKDAEAIRGLTRMDAEGREARRLAVFEGDAVRAEAAREVTQNIDQMNQATKNLSTEWREAKPANVAKTIDKAPEAFVKQSEIAIGSLTDTNGQIQKMLADPAAYGHRAALQKASDAVDVASRGVSTALEAGKGEDAFVALDTLKRKLGPLSKPGQMLSVAADAESAKELRKVYDNLKNSLTDQAWGKAGTMQADTNAAYEKWMGTKDLFDQRFQTQTGRQGWEKTFGTDPAKSEAYINGLTSPKNDLTHGIIRQHIENTKALAAELAKAGELTPAKAAELAAVTKSAQAFEKTIAKAEKSVVLTNQLRSLEQTDRAGIGSLVGGAVLGGPVGALAGAAFGALANPARIVRQLAAIERIAARVDAKLGAGVKAFVNGEAVEAVKRAPKAGTVAERFEKESRAVRTFAQNPALASERIAKSFGGLNDVAPSVASQLAFKATRSAQVLATMLPQGSTPGGVYQHLEKVRYSESDMQRWLHAKDVISNPVDVLLTGMEKDHISSVDLALIKEHSPKVYGQIVNMATTELANVKKPPSYQRKVQIGLLLGIPADKTMDPAFIQMTQGAYAAAAQQAQAPAAPKQTSGRRPTSPTAHGATASEAVEGR